MSVVSRSYFSYSVVLADYSDSNAVGANIRAVSGVNWTVDKVLANGSLASPRPTIYGDRTGSTPPNNYDDTPGIEEGLTDPNGLIEFWAPPGEYRINISDPGQRIGDKEITWNSVPAWEGGLPGDFIEEESLQGSQIADGQISTDDIDNSAITSAKIATGNVTFAKLNSDVSELIPPIGTMMDYSGTGDPVSNRWVLCDGRQLSQTTYAGLYAVVGNYYNTGGESSGNFRIPDLRGRATVGQENMGTGEGAPATTRLVNNNSIGNSAGSSNVSLSTSNIPRFQFTPTGSVTGTGGHSHSGSGSTSFNPIYNAASQGQAINLAGGTNFTLYRQNLSINVSVSGAGDHSHGFSGDLITIGQATPTAVDTRQPYLVVNKIIRIK